MINTYKFKQLITVLFGAAARWLFNTTLHDGGSAHGFTIQAKLQGLLFGQVLYRRVPDSQ